MPSASRYTPSQPRVMRTRSATRKMQEERDAQALVPIGQPTPIIPPGASKKTSKLQLSLSTIKRPANKKKERLPSVELDLVDTPLSKEESRQVTTGMSAFKLTLKSNTAELQHLIEDSNHQQVKKRRSSAANKSISNHAIHSASRRSDRNTLTDLEEHFLSTKKLKLTPDVSSKALALFKPTPKDSNSALAAKGHFMLETPKELGRHRTISDTPKELKGYFVLKLSVFHPKPWKMIELLRSSTSKTAKKERMANLLRIIRDIETYNAHLLLDGHRTDQEEGYKKMPVFLSRNLRKGKLGQQKYEEKMAAWIEKNRPIVPISMEGYDEVENKENYEALHEEREVESFDHNVPTTSKSARSIKSIRSNNSRAMVLRNANQSLQTLDHTPVFDQKMAADQGKIMFLQRMVELTFAEKEKAEVQLAKAKEFAKMAEQEHTKAMKKLIDAKRKYDQKNLTF